MIVCRTLVIVAVLLVHASCSSLTDGDGRGAVHILRSDSLSVEIMEPNHPERYNRGVRFIPAAAVLGVKMDGHQFLYCPAKHNPVTDHAGLASEFDLCIPGGPAGDLPPGYGEAKIGEGFLKIGVGVLKKQKGKPYNLFHRPELMTPAKTEVVWEKSKATFHQVCSGVNGYAFELWSVVQVIDNRVIVDWTLKNTGTKPFTTRNYVHNFFRFDDRNVGPGYVLTFPYDFKATGLERQQVQTGRNIMFKEQIPKWVNIDVPYPDNYTGPNTMTLKNTINGLKITCETSIPGIRTSIHARPGYISPEQFIQLTLQPGETKSWTRLYVLQVE